MSRDSASLMLKTNYYEFFFLTQYLFGTNSLLDDDFFPKYRDLKTSKQNVYKRFWFITICTKHIGCNFPLINNDL